MRRILGKYHCGNIRLEFLWPRAEPKIPARACNCTFCVKHHGVYTSDPEARLEVQIADTSRVRGYRFGTGTAEFHICMTCGVVPFVTSTIDGVTYAVVNVNAFDNVERNELIESPTDFNSENSASRLERRKRTWISNVRICEETNGKLSDLHDRSTFRMT